MTGDRPVQHHRKLAAAVIGVAVLIAFCLLPPLPAMDAQGMRILGTVLCAIVFWAGGVFPDWVTAMGLAILWIVLGKVPFAQAMAGYTSGSVWLVIWACCLAEAVERTGLFARISWGIIRLFKPDFKGIALSLFAVGLLFAPLIPSATAKAVLGAALAASLSDAMGYGKNSDGRCGLFIASFVGFSVSTAAFASGSVFTYTLQGMLPAEVLTDLSWIRWLASSLPWLAVTLVLCYAGICVLYAKNAQTDLDASHARAMAESFGPMTRKEKLAGLLLTACVLLWIFERQTGIPAAATAMAAAVLCFAAGLLQKEDLKNSVPWGLFLYLGVVLNLGNMFSSYGVNDMLKTELQPLIALMHSPVTVVLTVALLTVAVRFLLVSQTVTVAILMAVLLPAAQQTGASPFVMGFVILAVEQVWFAAYQNTVFGPALACLKGTLEHGKTVKASVLYTAAALLGCLVSIPWWRMFGYL
ncbi:MAG: anion permease [Firmicutes bacterium]|nr:anion permease [Bacillota bacterium]